MFNCTKRVCFLCGALFGSVGLKLLTSKDAQKVYTYVAAAGLRVKESVMTTVTAVRESAGDILADAKQINEDRAVQPEVIEDAAEEAVAE